MTSSSPSKPPLPNRVAATMLATALLASILASCATFANGEWIFLATGLWAMTIVVLPVAMDRRFDLFSIWSFVILTVAIGLTLRGACLSLGFPGPERLDHLFFRGQSADYFFPAAVTLLLGLGMLTAGFSAVRFRNAQRPLQGLRWQYSPRRLLAVTLVILVVSTVASVLFIQRTGGFMSDMWSAKRTAIPGGELAGTGYQSHGGLRFGASLAMFAHLLVMVELLSKPRTNRPRPLLLMLAAGLLLIACVVPFYASLRTTVAMNLCLSAAMVYYSGRRIRRSMLATTGVVVLLAVYAMTALRPGADPLEGKRERNTVAAPSVDRVLAAAVINRNQIELAKTAHILHAVPDTLPLKFGETISRWALAPIPRSLWPDKPVIPPGPEIGREVYAQPIAGVPPSLVAELWWNFHLPGVVIGGFSFGALLGFLQRQFANKDDLLRASIYVAGPMTIGFEAVGSSIGSGLFHAVLGTTVMYVFVFSVRSSGTRRQLKNR